MELEVAIFDSQSDAGQSDTNENDDKHTTCVLNIKKILKGAVVVFMESRENYLELVSKFRELCTKKKS